jgi:hypothetical protein
MIKHRGTLKARLQRLEDTSAGSFLLERVNTVFGMATSISARQQRRIDDALAADPDRVSRSKTIEALKHDAQIELENRLKLPRRRADE